MLSVKPWPTNPPRNVHIAPFGHISISAAQPAAVFLHKVASPFLWTRDDLRHLRAGKCLNRNPGRVGWNCDANRFLFNASATHHPRRGVLGVLAPSGRHVPGALAGWAPKVAKNSTGTYHETVVFQSTELQGCNEVLLCSARGQPLAPACADAWRGRSNALHNANDTDIANSLAHALRNQPEKSSRQDAEAEHHVASKHMLGMASGHLGVDHLALVTW